MAIPAFVNGAGPYPFILDTGADGSAAYQWFAEDRHLPNGKSEEMMGQTGTATIPTFDVRRLTVDGRERTNLTADGLPNRHDRGRQAGVVGNDFMDGAIVVFDYPCRSVSILSRGADLRALTSGARGIKAVEVKGTTQLIFRVSLNGAEGFAVLDTGSRDTRINTRFAALARVDTESRDFREGPALNGASGARLASKIGPIGSVQAVGLSVDHARGRVMDLPVFQVWGLMGQPAMILGMDQMKGYRLVYDHLDRQFWFTSSECKVAKPEVKQS